MGITTPLPPSGKGHHTERAHVITTPHNGHKGGHPVRAQTHRGDFRIGLLPGEQYIHRLLATLDLFQQSRQILVSIRPHHKVHQLLLLQ